ncbi:hypothetical protein DICVIV_07596 [Dictyocaulus viviparus]|uniref:Uncharacterized protein n=1 Tax=Dictyocaulus viviparus TaxID=29172 RepID=A0A0D8XRK4_DICVI|nr:hypothetical protein DICVIV_07596 [Dictyocaulus viviparus]
MKRNTKLNSRFIQCMQNTSALLGREISLATYLFIRRIIGVNSIIGANLRGAISPYNGDNGNKLFKLLPPPSSHPMKTTEMYSFVLYRNVSYSNTGEMCVLKSFE